MLEELDTVGGFMVLLGLAGGIYTLTYAVLMWRGHYNEENGQLDESTDSNDIS